jgi:superfamily II DNA helicase RecQ
VLSGELEVAVSISGPPRGAPSQRPTSPHHAGESRSAGTRAAASGASGGELDTFGQVRFERLRSWRLGLARAEARAAFTIFDDRTLREIAERDPRSVADLLRVRGVGPAKSSRYGEAVIGVLQSG